MEGDYHFTFEGFRFQKVIWHKHWCVTEWRDPHATWPCHTPAQGLTLMIPASLICDVWDRRAWIVLQFSIPLCRHFLEWEGANGELFCRLPLGARNLSFLFILNSLVNVLETDEADFFGACAVFLFTECRCARHHPGRERRQTDRQTAWFIVEVQAASVN